MHFTDWCTNVEILKLVVHGSSVYIVLEMVKRRTKLRGCVINKFNGIPQIGKKAEEFQHVQEDNSIEKYEQSAGNMQSRTYREEDLNERQFQFIHRC